MRIACLTALVLAACGENELEAIARLTGDPAAGADIFAADCAGCHGAAGEGASGPALAGEGLDAEEVIAVVHGGEDDMPGFADTLADQDIADVTSFVTGM